MLTTYDVVHNNWQLEVGLETPRDDITTWDCMVLDEVCLGGCYILVLSIGTISSFIKEP